MSFQNKYKIQANYAEHRDFAMNNFSEIVEGLPEIIVSESKNAYFVRALVAGLSINDLILRFMENQFELEVHLASPSGRYLFQERAVGKYVRRIKFVSYIDVNKIKSELENGLLFVKFPKLEKEEYRIIPKSMNEKQKIELAEKGLLGGKNANKQKR